MTTTRDTTAAAAELAGYGRSLLLDDGDLVIRDGSLATVEGSVNLRQGLLLRLLTPWGDDRLNTGYGLDAMDVFTAGLPRALVKEVLRLSLLRTVAADPRVASVDQVSFDDDAAYLAAHPEAAAAAGDHARDRVAVVEITVQPVAPAPAADALAAPGPNSGQLAAAAGGSVADLAALTLSTDVRW